MVDQLGDNSKVDPSKSIGSVEQDSNAPSAEREHEPPLNAREEWVEFGKTAIFALVLAILIRTFLLEPFNIPSGSMKPTLLVGDYLFVSKPAYGYSKHSFPFSFAPIQDRIWYGDRLPQRGDVVVFKLPSNTRVDFIKRIIGLPGDTIQVRKGRLYINDRLVERKLVGLTEDTENGRSEMLTEYIETLPGGLKHSIFEASDNHPLDNTDKFVVPADHYFMMGDNRDNSQDSRVMKEVGFVPFENIVGRAAFLFFSTDGSAMITEFWKWPGAIRYSRIFRSISPRVKDQDK